MAVKYGFFNSKNGDRLYNADDISRFFYKLISDGVLDSPATNLMVASRSGMTVQVLQGYGMINAKYVLLTSPEDITLDAADIALPRVDRVVLRLDINNRQITVATKKGTPAASPAPPALTRSGGIYELSLAKIAVAANAAAIAQADITDERPDESVCGYIVGLLQQIDTAGLFAQFTDAFDTWFAGVQDQVFRNTLVRRYTNRVLSTASQQNFSIGIAEWNQSTDILNVYVNGFMLSPGVDYSVSGAGGGTVVLANALDVANTPVLFEVLKSIDGSDAESIVTELHNLETRVDNDYYTAAETDAAINGRLHGLSMVKITKAGYDELESKDSNTLYIVVDADSADAYIGDIKIGGGGGGSVANITDDFEVIESGV